MQISIPTAEEAHKTTLDQLNQKMFQQIATIETSVTTAISKGEFAIDLEGTIPDIVTTALENLGYLVRTHCPEYDLITTISWSTWSQAKDLPH